MFPELEQARAHLTPFPGRYWIAGGWAVDLHAGSQTRVHKDVEIAIARQDQSLLWQLPDLARIDYIETRVAKPWNGEEIKYALKQEAICELLVLKYRVCVEDGLPDYDVRERDIP